MENPFVNDPFALVWQAFKNLYPDKDCEVNWYPDLPPADDGNPAHGATDFGEDGTVRVFVDTSLRVNDAVEILAHELAHVAVGIDGEHGDAWEAAFDAIFREYSRIGDEMFGKREEAE